MKDVIGWASSFVLVMTIGTQVHKQWKAGTSEGVSKWLYVGQMAASAGFTTYSALVRDWVFVVTNAILLVSAAVGFGIFLHHRRADRRRASQPGATPSRTATPARLSSPSPAL